MSRQCVARIQEQGWRCFQRSDERSLCRAGDADRGRERTVGHLARAKAAPCVYSRLTRRVSAQKTAFFRKPPAFYRRIGAPFGSALKPYVYTDKDASTKLNGIVLHNEKYSTASLADIHWSDANIAVVDWSTISILGDEHSARRGSNHEVFGVPDVEYTIATRVYRQLSVVLRNQGLSEDANRFAYRAQLMQRKVFWHQRKMLHYLGSLFLALLSGYGYKPIRSFLAYLIVILAFATTYCILGRTVGPALSPLG